MQIVWKTLGILGIKDIKVLSFKVHLLLYHMFLRNMYKVSRERMIPLSIVWGPLIERRLGGLASRLLVSFS